jgi:hypothetical protein
MFAWLVAGSLIVAAPDAKEDRKLVDPPDGEWVEARHKGDDARLLEGGLPTFWRFGPKSFRLYGADDKHPVTIEAAYTQKGKTLEMDFGGHKAIWKVESN